MKSAGIVVPCCVVISLFLGSSFASAEPSAARSSASSSVSTSTREESLENLFYEFEDDSLNGLGHDAQGMVLRVRPGAARVLLLRPRVQFVTELLQSVEAL